MSNLNQKQYLFDNIDHFEKVIKQFGRHAFNEVVLSDALMDFVSKNFIRKSFSPDGVIYGTYDNTSASTLSPAQKRTRASQRRCMVQFFDIFDKDLSDNEIDTPTTNTGIIGEGSYGAITKYKSSTGVDQNKLVKFLTTDETGTNKFLLFRDSHDNKNYMWMVEFCTFVVVMGILKYVDCNMIVDGADREQCIKTRYQNVFKRSDNSKNYYLNYCSFFAKIHRPFAKKSIQQDGSIAFIVGYVIEKYTDTLDSAFKKMKPDDIRDCIGLFAQTVDIFRKMSLLENIGITISHRDTTARNIMYTKDVFNKNKYKIRLIDFGFLCCNVTFANGKNVSIGVHAFQGGYDLNKCNQKYHDIILFITWCIFYYSTFFDIIFQETHIYALNGFKSIASLQDKILRDKLESYTHSAWEYASIAASSTVILTYDVFDKIDLILTAVIDALSENLQPETTDYGDVFLFDLSGKDIDVHTKFDRFIKVYKQNKKAYLKL